MFFWRGLSTKDPSKFLYTGFHIAEHDYDVLWESDEIILRFVNC